MQKSKQKKIDFQDSPVVWFTILEIARKQGDFTQAAKAKKNLERLGVAIKYHKPYGH